MGDLSIQMDGLNRLLVEIGAEPVPIPPSPAELLRRAELARLDSEDLAADGNDDGGVVDDASGSGQGGLRGTFDDLVEVLRYCPAEEMPATVDAATAPEPPREDVAPGTSHSGTSLGTPRARAWDDAWLDEVEAAETRIGRRICGARLLDGTPCELGSTHRSGRCRFHGGFDLTGAPAGNRNAYIHGLYSRRLRTCGDHCPNWASCPMAQAHGGADLEAVPMAKRPVCPYEQAEYNTALADAMDLIQMTNWEHPFAVHIAHNMAILQVMVGRAASEMRNATVAAQTQAFSEKYSFQHEQVRPHINAITRLGAELRKYAEFLAKGPQSQVDWNCYQSRRRWVRDGGYGPEPEQFDYVAPDTSKEDKRRAQQAQRKARNALTRAVLAANDGDAAGAIEQWRLAEQTDWKFTDDWTKALRKSVKAKQRAAKRKG